MPARRVGLLLGVLCALAVAREVAPAGPAEEAGVLDRALRVAERDRPTLDRVAVLARIDELVARFHDLAGKSPDDAVRAAALGRLLFADKGSDGVAFTVVDDQTSLDALLVDTVLERRQGYCLSLSVIVLAVAERVGAPAFGVAAPNHFFVRYDGGGVRRNIELTRAGAEVTDDDYKSRMGGAYRADSIYLKNLNPAQIEAVLLHNRGFVAMAAGDKERARADLLSAAKQFPELPEAHRNLGVLLGEAGNHEAAIAEFDRALALYPGDAEALTNRALCWHALGVPVKALADLDVAILAAADPSLLRQMREDWRGELQLHDWKGWQTLQMRALEEPPADLTPGLAARYYAGTDLGGADATKPVLERVDANLDFDWQNRSPGKGVPGDRFSVHWEGWLRVPRTATYTLFLIANDGVRLRLDDRTLLENWRDLGYENYTGFADVELLAGWHRIEIEHYDQSGGARLLVRLGATGGQIEDLSKLLFH